jgi:hypothetical protein
MGGTDCPDWLLAEIVVLTKLVSGQWSVCTVLLPTTVVCSFRMIFFERLWSGAACSLLPDTPSQQLNVTRNRTSLVQANCTRCDILGLHAFADCDENEDAGWGSHQRYLRTTA